MDRKTKLSKLCLEMKFMKRTKERVEQEEDEKDREKLYQDQLSGLQSGSELISLVPSYYDCYEYLPCRLSFGGFEPETEKINLTKLKGLYTPMRVEVTPDEAVPEDGDHGMDVDATAEEVNHHLEDTQPPQHRNSKINRFEQKPKNNRHQQEKPKNNRHQQEKPKNNSHQQGKQGNKQKNKKFKKNNQNNSNDISNKRKHTDEEDVKLKIPRKFMKPAL